jgi:hypothetical protein
LEAAAEYPRAAVPAQSRIRIFTLWSLNFSENSVRYVPSAAVFRAPESSKSPSEAVLRDLNTLKNKKTDTFFTQFLL